MPARRTVKVDCRNTARDAARLMLMRCEGVEMGLSPVVCSSAWKELRQWDDFSARTDHLSIGSGTQHQSVTSPTVDATKWGFSQESQHTQGVL
jgi:hypothetical protein